MTHFFRSTLLGAALTMAAAAFGQPVPKINSVSPEWIQRGTTVEVTFSGENLGAVERFVFSGDAGLSATNLPVPALPAPAIQIESQRGGISAISPAKPRDEKRLVAKVTATADAPLGARELRAVSPQGISNPVQFNVGHLPEVMEGEPNNAAEQAQAVTLPAAINGVISSATEVDAFRFKAKQGERLVFDVDAARRGSALDSSLAILDAKGRELARNEDHDGFDSLIEFTVPGDGEYIAEIRDYRYQGGGNFNYRLYAGPIPYVDSVFPFGGQRGKQVEIALSGQNLEGTSKMLLNIAADAPLGRQEIRATTPRGFSNPFVFDVQDVPDFTEAEPNNETGKPNAIAIPVVLNGRVGAEKDVDWFKFKSDKDQRLAVEVAANRFGSPLDSLLMLADGKGSILQQNDDAAGADPRLEFDAKKDAEYMIGIRDLTDRGGDDLSYRISIRPPTAAQAGFTAQFLPDALRIHRGGRVALRCEVTRVAGFKEPVRFTFAELPKRLSAEPLILSQTPASGILSLVAEDDAPLGTFPVRLVASAVVNGKPVTHTARPIAGKDAVRQGFVTILEQAPFTIEPVTLTDAIDQDMAAEIEVMVQRREGFAGEIKLGADGFMAGRDPITKSFDIPEVKVKGGDAMAKVRLKAKQDSEVGTRTFVVKGETAVNGQPVVEYSSPIPLSVAQLPFLLSSTLSRMTVTALPAESKSAARETATTIKLERRDGFDGEVQLSMEGVPAGVEAVLDKIPANAGETMLKLTATEKAAPGTNYAITVTGTGTHKDRHYKRHTGKIALIINAPEPAIVSNAPPVAVKETPAAAAKTVAGNNPVSK